MGNEEGLHLIFFGNKVIFYRVIFYPFNYIKQLLKYLHISYYYILIILIYLSSGRKLYNKNMFASNRYVNLSILRGGEKKNIASKAIRNLYELTRTIVYSNSS